MTSFFAYGTSQCPGVLTNLLTQNKRMKGDVYVHNYVCHPVVDCIYPAAIPAPANSKGLSRVDGVLVFDLEDDDMAVLDEFEDEYTPVTAPIYTRDGEYITDAMFYIWKQGKERLDTSRVWTYENDFAPYPELQKRMIENAAELRRMTLSDD